LLSVVVVLNRELRIVDVGKMTTRLYVGRLPYRATERDVERFFRGYGRIREVILKNGYCFVDMEDYQDAEDAVYDLNGKELMNERLIIEIAKGTPHGRDRYNWRPQPAAPTSGYRRHKDKSRSRSREKSRDKRGESGKSYRVIIENLSSRVSWQDLKDLFRQVGEVTHVNAHGRHKNEGVVEFTSAADVKAAIKKFDGHELHSRKIKVFEEKSGKDDVDKGRRRSRSPRRDRSKSRSRTRSGSAKDRRRSKSNEEKNADADGKSKRSKSPSTRRSRSRSRSGAGNDEKRRRSESGDKRSASPHSINDDEEKNGGGENNDGAGSD